MKGFYDKSDFPSHINTKYVPYDLFIKQVQFDWYERRKESLSNKKLFLFY